MNRRHLICLILLFGTSPGWAQDVPDRPVVRVAYFIPTDRQAEPDHVARLDRVMKEVQRFYGAGMQHNEYGNVTFELDRDAQGKLRIYEVRAKGPMRDYGRNASDKVRREVRESLLKQGLDIDRETIVIFQLLLTWQGDRAEEIGPYVGGGGPRSGTAWVYDDAKLDPKLLSSRDPGGFYVQHCSLGEFNTHYMGGVAHELGHAFGLPHDCERASDRPKWGSSLMGGGNHTYGRELRNEGPGAFLSAASALPLSVHPVFTGKRKDATAMTCRMTALRAKHENGQLVLTGQLKEGPRVVGLVARQDGQQPGGDYDAVGWTCPVAADGQFKLVIGELKPGEYDLRMAAYGESGNACGFTFHYQIDKQGRPDLRPFSESIYWQDAQAAFRQRDQQRLTTIARDLKQQYPDDNILRLKVEHLIRIPTLPKPHALKDVPANVKSVPVADLAFEAETVGWGQPLRNRVLEEGDHVGLIEVGDKFFASGLYAHAPARHVLKLNGQWKTLKTGFGLQNGHGGSVIFVIKGDNRELFRSTSVRDHSAREQTVDLKGITQLELLVEDAADGGNSDWGVWLDPRLER